MASYVILTLDCTDLDRQEAFWAAALGYERHGGGGPFVGLREPGGTRPAFLLQRVPEPKTAKNRLHLDLHVPDVEAETARLEALGAVRNGTVVESGTSWVVMADPEGNEFCVCPLWPD